MIDNQYRKAKLADYLAAYVTDFVTVEGHSVIDGIDILSAIEAFQGGDSITGLEYRVLVEEQHDG